MFKTARDELAVQGFTKVVGILSEKTLDQCFQEAQAGIKECITHLGCMPEIYLKSVSRWLSPSPPLGEGAEKVIEKIKLLLTEAFEEDIYLNKVNLICKSALADSSIPFHQDIAYSPQAPYEFSVWIPLHKASPDSGGLLFMPRSHLSGIAPAVDFWSPYQDRAKEKSLLEQYGQIAVTAHPGDIIIFDSRLWHGSSINKKKEDRYAIASRWSRSSFQPDSSIPPIQPLFFGMWNCGQITQDLLRQGLSAINGTESDDKIKLIDAWQTLIKHYPLPFECERASAQEALESIKVLDLSSKYHNGGDALGIVYPKAWFALLKDLRTWVLTNLNQKEA